MASMDQDGSGSIDFEEFANWYLAAEEAEDKTDGTVVELSPMDEDAAITGASAASAKPAPRGRPRIGSDAVSIASGVSGATTGAAGGARGAVPPRSHVPAASSRARPAPGAGSSALGSGFTESGDTSGGGGSGPGTVAAPPLALDGAGEAPPVPPLTQADVLIARAKGMGPEHGRHVRLGPQGIDHGLIPGHYALAITGAGAGAGGGGKAAVAGPPLMPTGAGLIGNAKFTLLKLKLRALRAAKEMVGITARLMGRRAYISRSRVSAELAARAAFRAKRPPACACDVCILAFALHTDFARHQASGCRPRDIFMPDPWPPGSEVVDGDG